MGRSPSFEECLKPGQDLRKAYDSDPDAKRIVDVAQGLEGIVRNNSIHAAAVVIADRPLQEIVPLQLAEDRGAARDGNGNGGGRAERAYKIVTQYSMGPIEEIGLLKMDFLGLRNLDVIEDAVEIIRALARRSSSTSRRSRSTTRRPTRCSPAATRSASSSSSPRACARRCKQVKPTEFDDIVALGLALPARARCATSPTTRAASATRRRVTYPDPRLRPITEATYGCCIYQEQLMEIAKQMAGFSPAEADDLRKAVGKKKRDLMATMEDKFIDGLRGLGHRAPRSPRTSGR